MSDSMDLEINEIDPATNQTPIMKAAANGQTEKVKNLLLQPGILVNKEDYFGNTALHFALKYKDIVDILIKNGADINKLNKDNITPLIAAVTQDIVYSVKVLADKNNKLDEYNLNKALEIAISNRNNDDIINALLSHPAINQDYALGLIKKYSSLESVKILSNNNYFDINKGKTPLIQYFMENSNIEIVYFLLKARPDDVFLTNEHGMNANDLANQLGYSNVENFAESNFKSISTTNENKKYKIVRKTKMDVSPIEVNKVELIKEEYSSIEYKVNVYHNAQNQLAYYNYLDLAKQVVATVPSINYVLTDIIKTNYTLNFSPEQLSLAHFTINMAASLSLDTPTLGNIYKSSIASIDSLSFYSMFYGKTLGFIAQIALPIFKDSLMANKIKIDYIKLAPALAFSAIERLKNYYKTPENTFEKPVITSAVENSIAAAGIYKTINCLFDSTSSYIDCAREALAYTSYLALGSSVAGSISSIYSNYLSEEKLE
jgi:ankyrin repeat protein